MKRSLLLGIIGIAAALTTSTSRGQGGINIGNYLSPFNPVVWSAVAGGGRVRSTDGVNLALWWGQGSGLNDNQLSFGVNLPWKTDSEALGYFGYYQLTQAVLPGWNPGDTWTFQVRASGTSVRGVVDSRSVSWGENTNIQNIGGIPPGLPGNSQNSIGLTISVPEPSAFALAGLSLAGFAFFCRRN
jgi:PEP-CTERM motif